MSEQLHCVHSHSTDIDTHDAIHKVIEDCLQQLSSIQPQGAIVFFDVNHNPTTIINNIYQQWPDIQLAGCSSFGEFNNKQGMSDGSIQLVLFCGKHIEVSARAVSDDEQKNDIKQACQHLVEYDKAPAVSFLFSDIIQSFEIENILDQLNATLPASSVIVGGIAADDYDFITAYLICNRSVQRSGSVIFNLYGDIVCSVGSALGWKVHGKRGIVTKSKGNTVYEIDHQPAMQFYKTEAGGVHPNAELPLSISNAAGDIIFVRACTGDYTTEAPNSGVNYIGRIPEGCGVQLSAANKTDLLESFASSAQETLNMFPESRQIALGLCFSCVSRKIVLGTACTKESEIMSDICSGEFPVVGAYTYGEIAKTNTSQQTVFHNNSIITILLG